MFIKHCFPLLAWTIAGGVTAAPDPIEILRRSIALPSVAYSGEVSVLTWFGSKTRARELLVYFSPPGRFRREIVDQSGYLDQLIVSDDKTEWFYDRARRTAWKGAPADADYKILGPEEEYDLLSENYVPRLTGSETIAGFPCWKIEIVALKGGRPLRQLWVEKRHGIILQSKAYQPDGSLASTMRFLRADIPAALDESLFRFQPPLGSRVVTSRLKPGYLELEDARVASGIAPRHPSWLPAGYVFESLNVLPYQGATLLHYRYSDGIDAVSLFQCPRSTRLNFGDLPKENTKIGSRAASLSFGPDGKILEWPSGGQRFILVGNLPLELLRTVAESVQ